MRLWFAGPALVVDTHQDGRSYRVTIDGDRVAIGALAGAVAPRSREPFAGLADAAMIDAASADPDLIDATRLADGRIAALVTRKDTVVIGFGDRLVSGGGRWPFETTLAVKGAKNATWPKDQEWQRSPSHGRARKVHAIRGSLRIRANGERVAVSCAATGLLARIDRPGEIPDFLRAPIVDALEIDALPTAEGLLVTLIAGGGDSTLVHWDLGGKILGAHAAYCALTPGIAGDAALFFDHGRGRAKDQLLHLRLPNLAPIGEPLIVDTPATGLAVRPDGRRFALVLRRRVLVGDVAPRSLSVDAIHRLDAQEVASAAVEVQEVAVQEGAGGEFAATDVADASTQEAEVAGADAAEIAGTDEVEVAAAHEVEVAVTHEVEVAAAHEEAAVTHESDAAVAGESEDLGTDVTQVAAAHEADATAHEADAAVAESEVPAVAHASEVPVVDEAENVTADLTSVVEPKIDHAANEAPDPSPAEGNVESEMAPADTDETQTTELADSDIDDVALPEEHTAVGDESVEVLDSDAAIPEEHAAVDDDAVEVLDADAAISEEHTAADEVTVEVVGAAEDEATVEVVGAAEDEATVEVAGSGDDEDEVTAEVVDSGAALPEEHAAPLPEGDAAADQDAAEVVAADVNPSNEVDPGEHDLTAPVEREEDAPIAVRGPIPSSEVVRIATPAATVEDLDLDEELSDALSPEEALDQLEDFGDDAPITTTAASTLAPAQDDAPSIDVAPESSAACDASDVDVDRGDETLTNDVYSANDAEREDGETPDLDPPSVEGATADVDTASRDLDDSSKEPSSEPATIASPDLDAPEVAPTTDLRLDTPSSQATDDPSTEIASDPTSTPIAVAPPGEDTPPPHANEVTATPDASDDEPAVAAPVVEEIAPDPDANEVTATPDASDDEPAVEAPFIEEVAPDLGAPDLDAAPVDDRAPVEEVAPELDAGPNVRAASDRDVGPVVEDVALDRDADAPAASPAPVAEASADSPATDDDAPAEAPAPVAEAPVDAPAPVVEAPVDPAPVADARVDASEPVAEAPAEAPALVADAPADAPAPAVDPPAPTHPGFRAAETEPRLALPLGQAPVPPWTATIGRSCELLVLLRSTGRASAGVKISVGGEALARGLVDLQAIVSADGPAALVASVAGMRVTEAKALEIPAGLHEPLEPTVITDEDQQAADEALSGTHFRVLIRGRGVRPGGGLLTVVVAPLDGGTPPVRLIRPVSVTR
ncbi:MAG: hypothetical protein R3B09_19155 [Nannocystaceae bacterium]